jgi:hypothetical protein
MIKLFRCSDFNADISSWSIPKLVTLDYIFDGATKFNKNMYRWVRKRPDINFSRYLGEELLVYYPLSTWIEYE